MNRVVSETGMIVNSPITTDLNSRAASRKITTLDHRIDEVWAGDQQLCPDARIVGRAGEIDLDARARQFLVGDLADAVDDVAQFPRVIRLDGKGHQGGFVIVVDDLVELLVGGRRRRTGTGILRPGLRSTAAR